MGKGFFGDLEEIISLFFLLFGEYLSPIMAMRGFFPRHLPYFYFFLISSALNFLWRQYLNIRQLLRLKRPWVANPNRMMMTEIEYQETQAYNQEKLIFTIFSEMVYLSAEIGMVIKCSRIWNLAGVVIHLQDYVQGDIWHQLMFLLLQNLFLLPTQMLFDLYEMFIIEEKHGYNNKPNCLLYLKDQFNSQLLLAFLGGPIGYIFFKLLWLKQVVFATTLCVSISFFSILFHNAVWPLYYTFSKIKKEGVVNNVTALCQAVDYPLNGLYQMDGTKRSGHRNAMLFWIWNNKQIVFYDTIIDLLDVEEIAAVLAHELGRWYYSHTLKSFFATQFRLICIIAVFSMLFNDIAMYQEFGFERAVPAVGFMLFTKLMSPVDAIVTYLFNSKLWSWVYQADYFAVKLNHGEKLVTALQKINVEEKSMFDPDPMYANYHYGYPPTRLRIEKLRCQLQKKN